MGILERFTIRTRLTGLVGFAAFAMLAIGVLGINAMNTAAGSLESVYKDRLVPSVTVARINEIMDEARTQLLYALQHQPGSETEKYHEHSISLHFTKVEDAINESAQLWRNYLRDHKLSDDEKTLADQYEAKRNEYVEVGLLPALELLKSNDYVGAAVHLAKVTMPRSVASNKALEALSQFQIDSAASAFESASAANDFAQSTVGIVLIAAIAILSLVAFGTVRSIISVVGRLNDAASLVAEGNLTARCGYRSRDELESSPEKVDTVFTRLIPVQS